MPDEPPAEELDIAAALLLVEVKEGILGTGIHFLQTSAGIKAEKSKSS
jgi:hypothetical protein